MHNLCLSFLLGITAVPREIESNAYAEFWEQIRCIKGNVEGLLRPNLEVKYTLPTKRYGQYFTHAHGHITREVVASTAVSPLLVLMA